MTLFIVIGLLMIVLAVGLVVTPLLRNPNEPGVGVTATVTAVVLPAAIVMMYLAASNFDWDAPVSTVAGNAGMPDIVDAIAGLEDRLRREPDDLDGWLLLARTYTQQRRFTDAAGAYREALRLDAGNDAKLGLAEIAILTDRSNLAGEAGEIVEEILAAEPDNQKALFYGGMVAGARNDPDTFKLRWQRLLASSPSPEIRQFIEAQLAALDTTAVAVESDKEEGGGIDVRITVTDELAAKIKPGAMLFLVAREPNRPGPPVAVVRENAVQLPITVRITDANSMLPGRSISTLDQVHLIARIANGGEPTAQPGDISGEQTLSTDAAQAAIVNIHMDHIVQ